MPTDKFYVTSAIPYVNDRPHMGHALEFVQVDVVARYQKALGKRVFFTTGSDENALKNIRSAQEKRISVQTLCDQMTKEFKKFAQLLNIQYDVWQRGSDKNLHWPGVQKLWLLCYKAGDIYKKKYRGYYCQGCEAFLTKKELKNGLCPYHLKKPEVIEEENYFFRLSKYQKTLQQLIESDVLKILPQERKNEVLNFIKKGLQDFSISRSRKRAPGWGIPVPNDNSQIIYVWYDALTIYMTAVGWGYNQKLWQKWWPADLHIIGKDITRFHAIYWPAILLSANLPLPKALLVHGFVTSGGQKMSKTLGNVIDPISIINQYGSDALRFYLLKEIPTQKDGDFTLKHFKEIYNTHLVNGLGNLVQRVAKLAEKVNFSVPFKKSDFFQKNKNNYLKKYLDNYRFNEALSVLWEKLTSLDKKIENQKPWQKKGKDLEKILKEIILEILQTISVLKIFLPQTANLIEKIFTAKKIKAPQTPLFPKKE